MPATRGSRSILFWVLALSAVAPVQADEALDPQLLLVDYKSVDSPGADANIATVVDAYISKISDQPCQPLGQARLRKEFFHKTRRVEVPGHVGLEVEQNRINAEGDFIRYSAEFKSATGDGAFFKFDGQSLYGWIAYGGSTIEAVSLPNLRDTVALCKHDGPPYLLTDMVVDPKETLSGFSATCPTPVPACPGSIVEVELYATTAAATALAAISPASLPRIRAVAFIDTVNGIVKTGSNYCFKFQDANPNPSAPLATPSASITDNVDKNNLDEFAKEVAARQADIAVLFVNSNALGISYLRPSQRKAVLIVSVAGGSTALAHELGHLMGGHHSGASGVDPPYAVGFCSSASSCSVDAMIGISGSLSIEPKYSPGNECLYRQLIDDIAGFHP